MTSFMARPRNLWQAPVLQMHPVRTWMPCRLESFWTSEYPTGDPSARARLKATAGGVWRNVAFVVPCVALSLEVSGVGV
jgi:hypothetical protein